MYRLIKRCFAVFGLSLARQKRNRKWENVLSFETPDVIIDVGVGYGTPHLHQRFPNAYLILIEPLSDFKDSCEAILGRREGEYHNYAIGREDSDDLMINQRIDVPEQTSLLKKCVDFTSGREEVILTPVKQRRLDSLLLQNEKLSADKIFLKIDAQGNELNVLRGAEEILKRCGQVAVHAVIPKIHETNYSLYELIDIMGESNFKLISVLNALIDNDNKCQMVDLYFEKFS